MALNAYLQQVQRLLNDENSQFYSISDLTVYVNLARGTIASQSECLIQNTTLTTTNATQSYALSSLTPPTGLSAAINVRTVRSIVASVGNVLEARPWQWMVNYYLQGTNTTSTGTPTVWSMQNQGSLGTLWFWPIPNGSINLTVEATWVPIPLVNDSTVEVLAYPWTDAVPYFAAALAYLNAQRSQDAQRMMSMFNTFMKAARVGVTPEWMSPNFPGLKPIQGSIDPLTTNLPGGKPSGPGGEGQLG